MTGVLPTRWRQLRAALPLLVRAVRWQPVPVAGALAAVVLWWRHDDVAEPAGAVWLLRGVAVLLAAALPFALDDRTRATLASVPTPLWSRVVARLVLVLLPAAAVWAVAAGWVAARSAAPVADVTLEAAGLAGLALATALALARWWDVTDPGVVTAPFVVALGLGLNRLPAPLDLFALPGPAWEEAHLRWAGLVVVAAVAAATALTDPGRRRRRLAGVPG